MSKTKRPRSHKDITHDEIQALLTKLKEIVPNMPRNRKLSKLEIIQYVIDYIVDLQIALESHPSSNRGINPRSGSSSNRQPLGVISSPSNSTANKCVVQELSHIEKLPSQRPDTVFSWSTSWLDSYSYRAIPSLTKTILYIIPPNARLLHLEFGHGQEKTIEMGKGKHAM